MAPVADGFTVDGTFQHCAHDGGTVLMEQTHHVEGVGAGGYAPVNGVDGGLVVRVRVAHGQYALTLELADHLRHALYLRSHGHVPDPAAGPFLVAPEEGGIPFPQQLRGHGPLIFQAEKGPLQVNTQAFRAVGGAVYEVTNSVDGPLRGFHGVGEDRGQKAGDALACKEGGEFGQVLIAGGVDIHTGAAVGVYIDEAGGEKGPVKVHDIHPCPVQMVPYGGNAAIPDQDLSF